VNGQHFYGTKGGNTRMEHPAGESDDGFLRLDFDRRLKLEFHGCRITSDAVDLPTPAVPGTVSLRPLPAMNVRELAKLHQLARDSLTERHFGGSAMLGPSSAGSWTLAVWDGREGPIGVCRLLPALRPRSAYVSFWIGPPYRGQGRGTQALAELARVSRPLMRAIRLKAWVRADNAGSRRVLERNGFVLWTLHADSSDAPLLYACELEEA
jgi:GNAT superfamily N-acetyltransferase